MDYEKYKNKLKDMIISNLNIYNHTFLNDYMMQTCNGYEDLFKNIQEEKIEKICNSYLYSKNIFLEKDRKRRGLKSSSKSKFRKGEKEKMIQLFKVFMVNLIGKGGAMNVSFNVKDYLPNGIYHKIISYNQFLYLTDALQRMDYIKKEVGCRYKCYTKIILKKKFIKDFYELLEYKIFVTNNGRVVGFECDKEDKKQIAEEVVEFTNFSNKHNFSIKLNEEVKNTYSQRKYKDSELGEINFKRIFSGKNLGGRWYGVGEAGIYQRLPKKVRECIKIDGNDCLQIDFKCEHLNILYSKNGINMWQELDDAYAIDGINKEYRFIIKTAVLILLNCKNERCIYPAICHSMNRQHEEYKRKIFEKFKNEYDEEKFYNVFIKKIKEKHHLISEYFCTQVGTSLQYKDSEIMSLILKECMNEEFPVLPVHDSVIVQKKNEIAVKKIMKEAFKKITGFEPIVE
jgi:hypothetical protein